jgi:hypothetical protein
MSTEPVKIRHSFVTGACMRDLDLAGKRLPTAQEFLRWANGLQIPIFPYGITEEQAQYIIDTPNGLFGDAWEKE